MNIRDVSEEAYRKVIEDFFRGECDGTVGHPAEPDKWTLPGAVKPGVVAAMIARLADRMRDLHAAPAAPSSGPVEADGKTAAPSDPVAWTDGSCLGNPGPGGWGVILEVDGSEQEISGHERQTTNNRMEIEAAIRAVLAAPRGRPLTVVSDSQYVRDGITKWIKGWKRNGWRTAAGAPVKNKELWERLDEGVAAHGKVSWRWVRGHDGNAMNERVDVVARTAAGKSR